MKKGKSADGLFVLRCCQDELGRVAVLDPTEELAWRRLQDHIYASNDRVPDKDMVLADMTRTGNRWKRVKVALIEAGLIVIEDGRITSPICRNELERIRARKTQTGVAGKVSAERRKTLKSRETVSTDVAHSVEASVDYSVEGDVTRPVASSVDCSLKIEPEGASTQKTSPISDEKSGEFYGGPGVVDEFPNQLKSNETAATSVAFPLDDRAGASLTSKPITPKKVLGDDQRALIQRAALLNAGGAVAASMAKTWAPQDMADMVRLGLVTADVAARYGWRPAGGAGGDGVRFGGGR